MPERHRSHNRIADGIHGTGKIGGAVAAIFPGIDFQKASAFGRGHMMKRSISFAVVATASLAAFSTQPAAAQSIADFYRGRTVTLIVGFPPGGGYDANIRALGRHLGKHIPGQPTVVVSNMPGAGSLTAANYIYRSAPADGTTMGMFASSTTIEPIFGNKAAQFDPLKFGWIGSIAQDVAYCAVWQAPGAARNFDEMMTKETIFGGAGLTAITYQHPMVLKNVLGARIKVVTGYGGTRDVNLAMNRGEVNGTCGLFTSSILSQWPDDVKSGKLKLVIQGGARKADTFGPVPSVFDYAKTDEQRAILDVHFRQLLLARPLAAPPGLPPERLAALQTALFDTLKDPEFLADAHRGGIEVDPATADDIHALLSKFEALPPDIIQKAFHAMGR
jgi:tripartite-type tricarboxylate transporter receptor subunit TctC